MARKQASVAKVNQKQELSAEQVAEVCEVSWKTVLRWIKDGYLEGYKLPSGQNRINRDKLVEFLNKYKMRSCIKRLEDMR